MVLQFQKHEYLMLDEQPLAGTTLTNWMKLLVENHFHISWPFLPKALYVTLMVLALSPLRRKEQKFCATHLSGVTIPPPLFIIGHWRSGTTFLHYLMGQDPQLAYVSTMETMAPHVFLTNERLLRDVLAHSLPDKRPMDNLEMKANLPYEDEYALANLCPYSFYHGWYFPRNIDYYFDRYVLFNGISPSIIDEWGHHYTMFLKKIAYKHDGKRILLKSLVNTAKIRALLTLFPDAQFIHIYRNPYEVYMSTWNLYEKILPIFSFQHIKKEHLDQSILSMYKDLYTRYFEEKKLIPKGNLIEISYEEFFRNPLENLEHIYRSLRLGGFTKAKPAFQQYIKQHERYKKNTYTFDDAVRNKVYQAWKFAFDVLGYEK
jgi:hypothetical protein